jgi:hypothetical protein
MINYHAELVSALKTILPTHYELKLHSGLATPCISYMEVDNASRETGDTIGYSSLQYQIKVWGNRIEDLQKYALQIDNKLRPLGWTRVSCRELQDNESTMMQKVMLYEATALENFE